MPARGITGGAGPPGWGGGHTESMGGPGVGASPSPQRCCRCLPPRAGGSALFPFIAQNTAPALAGRKKPQSPPQPPKKDKSLWLRQITLCLRRGVGGTGQELSRAPPGQRGEVWAAPSTREQPRRGPLDRHPPPRPLLQGARSGAQPLGQGPGTRHELRLRPHVRRGRAWHRASAGETARGDGPLSSPERGLLPRSFFLMELGQKNGSLGGHR